MLLEFTRELKSCYTFHKDILLILQPAEEGLGRAKDIVVSGLLTDYNLKGIFGKSGHGAMLNISVDSILVTAKLLEAYQSIITRSLSPLSQPIISFG